MLHATGYRKNISLKCLLNHRQLGEKQLADALVQLQGDPQRCRTMSTNAAALYRKQFVAENIYDAMADHLLRVASAEPIFAHAA